MSTHKPRDALLFSFSLLVLLVAVPTIDILSREGKAKEQFFAMSVLGGGRRLEGYYPDNDPNIEAETVVSWYIAVYNRMGSPQRISIKAKLLNATMQEPSVGDPSPAPVFFETARSLENNETWIFPFEWSIVDFEYDEDYITIRSVKANDLSREINVLSNSSVGFRIVFELWVYDPDISDFSFTWKYGFDDQSVWNYIWFNLKLD